MLPCTAAVLQPLPCSHVTLFHAKNCRRDVDYGDLNRELRKIIVKDSNVMCVAEAIACTGALAQGLRSAFSGTAKGLIEVRGQRAGG